jgi:hypothetical protein
LALADKSAFGSGGVRGSWSPFPTATTDRSTNQPKMGLKNHKLEGGQGGKRGHSGMEHWHDTDEIKTATRRLRRRNGKAIIRKELEDIPSRRKST